MLARVDGPAIKILIVEDEHGLAATMSMGLGYDGADVVTVDDGTDALAAVQRGHFDVIIIDPNLPDMDGTDFLTLLRTRAPGAMVLLLGSRQSEPTCAVRAAVGAHWLAKPFSLEEMVRELRLLLRSSGVALRHDGIQLAVDDLVLNDDRREITRGGDIIELPYRQFELLRYFMLNERRVLTKRQILGRVWPYDFAGHTNVVQLYVSYLRKGIDAGRAPLIHTVHRRGYILKSDKPQINPQQVHRP